MRRGLGVALVLAAPGASAVAQNATRPAPTPGCTSTMTRTVPREAAGAVIRQVSVKTDAPVALPILGERLARFRRTTVTKVVSRQLLFAPGDRADTARMAESLRRLRDQRLYADVVMTVDRCVDSDSVDIVVTTRDAWSLHPTARIVPPATVSFGAEDRNVLGTGRALSVTNDQTMRGHGGSVIVTDPFLFGSDIFTTFRFSDVAGNHTVRASLRHHELSQFDPWRFETAVSRQTFSDTRVREHPLASFFVQTHLGHLVGGATQSITVPYLGPQIDSAEVLAVRRGDADTLAIHRRRFIGLDLGVLHRAAVFDTVGWFAPGYGFLDLPLNTEGDLLLSPGTERAQHAAAAKYDAWLGRVWIPQRGRLLTADAWTSGYLGHVRANHLDRLLLGAYSEASRGFWAARAMFEQLLQLDPDLRVSSLANSNNDPTFAAIPLEFRQADRALLASVERSVHLHAVGRASVLDGSFFTAGSLRWDAPTMGNDQIGVGVLGARLRLLSANGAITSVRADVAFPVIASGSVVHRPLLTVSFGPLFDVSRERDGRRRQR